MVQPPKTFLAISLLSILGSFSSVEADNSKFVNSILDELVLSGNQTDFLKDLRIRCADESQVNPLTIHNFEEEGEVNDHYRLNVFLYCVVRRGNLIDKRGFFDYDVTKRLLGGLVAKICVVCQNEMRAVLNLNNMLAHYGCFLEKYRKVLSLDKRR